MLWWRPASPRVKAQYTSRGDSTPYTPLILGPLLSSLLLLSAFVSEYVISSLTWEFSVCLQFNLHGIVGFIFMELRFQFVCNMLLSSFSYPFLFIVSDSFRNISFQFTKPIFFFNSTIIFSLFRLLYLLFSFLVTLCFLYLLVCFPVYLADSAVYYFAIFFYFTFHRRVKNFLCLCF